MSRGLDINVPKSCRLSVRICACIGIGPKGIYVSAKRFVHLMCYVGSVEKSWGFFHVLYVCTSPRHILGASNTPDCGRFSPLVWGYPYNQPLRGCRSSQNASRITLNATRCCRHLMGGAYMKDGLTQHPPPCRRVAAVRSDRMSAYCPLCGCCCS